MGYRDKFQKMDQPDDNPQGLHLTIQGEADGSFALPDAIPFEVNGVELIRATKKGKPFFVVRIVPHADFRVSVDGVEQVIRPFVANLFLADPRE